MILIHYAESHAPNRMFEAFMDPKTWLFALFSALDNVPNSLTNQRQIIVSSFGFTALQTTLLGCVDGVVEIITIWVGVSIASRIPNSRAYVGTIFMIPNLVGVFLINLLPWTNKVGLLFAQWTTGALSLSLGISGPYPHHSRRRHNWVCSWASLALECYGGPHQESYGQRDYVICILYWQCRGSLYVAGQV